MEKKDSIWQSFKPGTLLQPDEIHVWRASLELNEVQKEKLSALLSADELEKAQRFHFEKDQSRFIAARGILRQILGIYLDTPPNKLRFEYSPYGKPTLTATSGQDRLHFNLSHSEDLALYAFTQDQELGIDLERIRNDIAITEIAQYFFSKNEINVLEKLHSLKQHDLFFKYWTRKEALIKANGKGILLPLDAFDVSSFKGDTWWPITFPNDSGKHTNWSIQDLFPGSGYCAAIAVREKTHFVFTGKLMLYGFGKVIKI